MPAERHSAVPAHAPKAADPFTLDVIQEALAATADEMFAVLKKTAMSPIIYEVLDVGTGVTDAQGDLVASGAGIPGFVGALDKTIKRLLEIVRPDEIEPDDIFVTNDPYYGGVTHLNDVVLAMPVFAGGALVAWVANIAHWNDVGGAVPGSMSVDARDIHAEGLRLPAIKLVERGRAIEPVMKILAANSRLPDFVRGDLWAAVASVRKGAERVERLVAAYGSDAFVEAVVDCHNYAERRARAGLARLPKGRLALEEPMDDGSVWRAAIDITEDAFVVDLREAPDQRADPLNTSRDGAVIAAQLIFKAATSPGTVCNAGSFRPLRVLTRPGSIFERADGTGGAGLLFRSARSAYRYAVAWAREGRGGRFSGRPFRLDLRHGGRRTSSANRTALRHGRAADGWMGRNCDPGRRQRAVLIQSRRDFQLSGRDRRGALRLHLPKACAQ